jgi:hypothetical protein
MPYSLSEAAEACGLNAPGNGARHLASGRPGGSAAPAVLEDMKAHAGDRTRMPVGRDRSRRPVRPNLHATCECCSLDERDAIIDALRPLVEQGWQIDLTYSFDHQLTPRRVTLLGWLGLALIATRGQLGGLAEEWAQHQAVSVQRLLSDATAKRPWWRRLAG